METPARQALQDLSGDCIRDPFNRIQQEARGTDTERYLQSDRNSSLKEFLHIFSLERAGDAYLKGGRRPVFREKCGEKCKKM